MHACMHACINASMHIYIPTYGRTYIHYLTLVSSYIHNIHILKWCSSGSWYFRGFQLWTTTALWVSPGPRLGATLLHAAAWRGERIDLMWGKADQNMFKSVDYIYIYGIYIWYIYIYGIYNIWYIYNYICMAPTCFIIIIPNIDVGVYQNLLNY